MKYRIITDAPKVFVAGMNLPAIDGINDYLAHRGETWNTQDDIAGDPVALVEFGGRVCYQSWLNPKGRSRHEYVNESIMAHDHWSVTRHAVLTLALADVPRSVQLELNRHTVGVAPSWESQRFTDKHLRFIAPPAIRGDEELMESFTFDCGLDTQSYKVMVEKLTQRFREQGTYEGEPILRRKKAKEAARGVLPNWAGSDGVVTYSAQALRHLIALRTDPGADESIRECAYAMFEAVRAVIPTLFSDAVVRDALYVPHVTFKDG